MINLNATTPTLAISDSFFSSMERLPGKTISKVAKFIKKFGSNPTSKGIHYEKVNNPSEPLFRSARIDDDYRLIIKHPEDGNVFILLYVAKHDDAYEWAETHRCKVNSRTNTLQVFKAPPATETSTISEEDDEEGSGFLFKELVPPVQPKLPGLFKPLFTSFSDEDLLSIGVPRETLSLVRSFCSFDDIHHNRKDLPPDVFDSLCALAEGDSLEEVKKLFENSSAENEQAHKQLNSDKEPFAEVNERTQRGFKLLGADDLMEEVTKESLLTWRIFLHPYQKKLVERKSLTPMLVRGVAGTGKTLVALYRANFLAGEIPPNSSQKILLTTFTKNLAEDLSAQLNNICSDEARAKIEVANIDAWVSGFLKQNNCPFNIVYPGSPVYESCWKNAITYADPSAKLDDDFYDTEWRRVILEQGIRTENEYLRAPRRGRGSSITREQRKKAWVVFEEMRSNLEKRHAMTIEDACAMARGILTANPGFANYFSVIVDETQDMNEQALKLLAALAKHTPESEPAIFMVGDAHQRIYARKVSLGACGINVRGRRSTRLKLVYRTTEEIRKLSEKVLLGQTVDDMDEGVEGDQALTSAYSLRHGKAPEIYDAVDEDAQVDWVLDQIRAADCPDNEACVVFRTKEFLKAFKDKLDERRCPNVVIKSSENTTSPGIRLSTMHRVKGLEFKLLFIADCNQGIVPLEKALKSSDKQEKAIKEMTERSLFYVACSRARDKLLISSTGTKSEYLKR